MLDDEGNTAEVGPVAKRYDLSFLPNRSNEINDCVQMVEDNVKTEVATPAVMPENPWAL